MKIDKIRNTKLVLPMLSISIIGTLIVALAFLLSSCCPPICIGNCHAIPDSDSISPQAGLTIEYWDASGQPHVEGITADRTINISQNQRFNIIYTGTDNVGIKYLWLNMKWTQWVGSMPQSVTANVTPKDFGSSACSPRSAASKFPWQGSPRAYTFSAVAEDYHGNRGHSATLRVIHGEPPVPLEP